MTPMDKLSPKPLHPVHTHTCHACEGEFVCCCANPKQKIFCLSCKDLQKQLREAFRNVALEKVE
jgi:hypothetical protein